MKRKFYYNKYGVVSCYTSPVSGVGTKEDFVVIDTTLEQEYALEQNYNLTIQKGQLGYTIPEDKKRELEGKKFMAKVKAGNIQLDDVVQYLLKIQ